METPWAKRALRGRPWGPKMPTPPRAPECGSQQPAPLARAKARGPRTQQPWRPGAAAPPRPPSPRLVRGLPPPSSESPWPLAASSLAPSGMPPRARQHADSGLCGALWREASSGFTENRCVLRSERAKPGLVHPFPIICLNVVFRLPKSVRRSRRRRVLQIWGRGRGGTTVCSSAVAFSSWLECTTSRCGASFASSLVCGADLAIIGRRAA